MEKVVVVSGGFDPLHIGHIELFKKARGLGDKLIVIVNSDEFLLKKKGYLVMDIKERMDIIKSLKCVDEVVECIDEDESVCKTLGILKPSIFANGGDRFKDDIAEREVCERLGIEMVFGLGEKIQSSSNIIKKARKHNKYLDLNISIEGMDIFKKLLDLMSYILRDERIDLEVREEMALKVSKIYEEGEIYESGK